MRNAAISGLKTRVRNHEYLFNKSTTPQGRLQCNIALCLLFRISVHILFNNISVFFRFSIPTNGSGSTVERAKIVPRWVHLREHRAIIMGYKAKKNMTVHELRIEKRKLLKEQKSISNKVKRLNTLIGMKNEQEENLQQHELHNKNQDQTPFLYGMLCQTAKEHEGAINSHTKDK